MDAGKLIEVLRATLDPNQREQAEKQLTEVSYPFSRHVSQENPAKMADIEHMCETRKFNIKGNCHSLYTNIQIFKNNLISSMRNKF